MSDTLTYQERVAIARLHALLELLPTALDHQLIAAGMTSFEYTLLEALSEAPERYLRLTALASRTNATLPRLSRVVSALEKKGLVRRAKCSSDARATNAFITDAGLEAQKRAQPVYSAAARQMILSGLESLGDDGVQQLADVSLAVLRKLDPDGRLKVTTTQMDAVDGTVCPVDPPLVSSCPADPPLVSSCPADPPPVSSCPADPPRKELSKESLQEAALPADPWSQAPSNSSLKLAP